MNNIKTLPYFDQKFKRFAKKFKSLTLELESLAENLLANPTQGVDLGGGLYKIRLAVESKGGGKSGGFRVVTYLVNQTDEGKDIYLVAIYDKSEESTMQKKVLLKLVKAIEI